MTFSNVELKKNREYIKNRISPLNPLSVKSIQVSDDNQFISLKVFNKTKFPIEIKNIVYNEKNFKVKTNTILMAKRILKRPEYINIEFFLQKRKT